MPPAVQVLLVVAIAWIALVALWHGVIVPWLVRGPGGSVIYGLLWRATRIYCRLLHRSRSHGEEPLRHLMQPGGLIVLSNHTSALDPLLIQAACRFRIRWMMAADMMGREFDWLWESLEIIPVARGSRDSAALREAIRHVKGGGVLGIFPEGRIVTRGEIRPFLPGVGMIVARTKAPVLLVWVSGTPESHSVYTAFLKPSRSRVEFIQQMRFDDESDSNRITQRLRERLAEASGWPLNDTPMTPEEEAVSDVYRRDAETPQTSGA